jgi:hypothetical protein
MRAAALAGPTERSFSSGRRQFGDYVGPQRSFGMRVVARSGERAPTASVDRVVPDLRRRIGQTSSRPAARLPVAVAGVAFMAGSALMWLDALSVARLAYSLF